MRDQNAQFVTAGVEGIVLVDAATPDAQGVDVRGLRGSEQLVVTGFVDPGEDGIDRRPIHSLEKDLLSVDRENERDAAIRLRFLDELHGADAEAATALVELASIPVQRRAPFVQRLRAVIVRPPESGLRHDEPLGAPCAGGVTGQVQRARLAGDRELHRDRARHAVIVPQFNERLDLGRTVGAQRHCADMDVVDFHLVHEQP